MPTTYKVVTGDTAASISRKQFGTEAKAGLIYQANPGLAESTLTPGTEITIPKAPSLTPKTTDAASSTEVSITVEGSRFRFWDNITFTLAADAIPTVEFGAPMEPSNADFKRVFRPFSYYDVETFLGGSQLFAGTLVGIKPGSDAESSRVTASCYGRPGVLNDCTMPASAFPLQFDGLTLKAIIEKAIAPFGLSAQFDADTGAVFDSVALEPGAKVWPFLAGLAKKRNLLLTSTAAGALRVWAPTASGQVVAKLADGQGPVVRITPFFSEQDYYSHVTGLEPTIAGLAGSKFTVTNARLKGVVRPYTFQAEDTETGTVKTAVQSKISRMFASAVSYSVEVDTWQRPDGSVYQPGDLIMLRAPRAMVYDWFTFMVRNIRFNADARSRTATLNLVLPEAFTGAVPEAMPWD